MAVHGKNTGIVLGTRDVTRWCNEVSSDQSVDVADASCFDEPEGAKVYVQGLRDTKFSYGAREQGTPDGLRQLEDDIAATDLDAPFMVGLDRGFHPGRIVQMGSVLTAKVSLSAPVGDVVQVSGDLQANGHIYLGRSLALKAAYTASATGAQVDLGSPADGALIQFYVVENTSDGSTAVTVQHSDDGSTWVDYSTVTVQAGDLLGEARVVEDSIDRYVRVVVAKAGSSGSATIRVAIARRS